MKPISSKNFTFLLTNRLLWSSAYQALSKSAMNLDVVYVRRIKIHSEEKNNLFVIQIMEKYLSLKQNLKSRSWSLSNLFKR